MGNWEQARKAVLERLTRVRELVDGHDEGAVMALLNQQDAFCDAAEEGIAAAALSGEQSMCSFCQASLHSVGCFERLGNINEAVLDGRWDEAGTLVDEYRAWVKGLSVPSAGPAG